VIESEESTTRVDGLKAIISAEEGKVEVTVSPVD